MSEQSLPDVGDTYRHKGNGKEYRVLEIVQVEEGDGGCIGSEGFTWVGGVRYCMAGDVQYPESYVRTLERFANRSSS